MKLFKLVPVAFRHGRDDETGWQVVEIPATTDHYNPETEKMETQFGGVEELETYLMRGWNIVTIQSTPIPGSDSCPGAAITQYLLSIDIPDGNVPQE